MPFLGALLAALLALAPHVASAHGGHERTAPPAAAEGAVHPPIALPSPCPGGTQQACGCQALGACGETPVCAHAHAVPASARFAPQPISRQTTRAYAVSLRLGARGPPLSS